MAVRASPVASLVLVSPLDSCCWRLSVLRIEPSEAVKHCCAAAPRLLFFWTRAGRPEECEEIDGAIGAANALAVLASVVTCVAFGLSQRVFGLSGTRGGHGVGAGGAKCSLSHWGPRQDC